MLLKEIVINSFSIIAVNHCIRVCHLEVDGIGFLIRLGLIPRMRSNRITPISKNVNSPVISWMKSGVVVGNLR